jgi:hypothetical protein
MDRNTETGHYELSSYECKALDLPAEQASWPMNNSSGLLDLAQVRIELINSRDLSEIPSSPAKMQASEQQWRETGYLRKLIDELQPDLPSVTDGVEQFLRQDI